MFKLLFLAFLIAVVSCGCINTASHSSAADQCGLKSEWELGRNSGSHGFSNGMTKVYVQMDGYYCRGEYNTFNSYEDHPNNVYWCEGSLSEGTDYVFKHATTDGLFANTITMPYPNQSTANMYTITSFIGENARGNEPDDCLTAFDEFDIDCDNGWCKLDGYLSSYCYVTSTASNCCPRINWVEFHEDW